MKHPHIFVIVLLFISARIAMAQTSETDSLKALLSTVKDTTRVNVLGKLGYRLAFSDPPAADKYLQESISLAKAIDFKKGQAYAYMVLGISLDLRAQYVESTEAFTTGSLILKQLDTTRLVHRELRVGMLNGLGLAHYHQSNYKEALAYFLQALPIAEKISNKSRLSALLVNVGLVYHDLNEVDRALEYYQQALTLSEGSRNKSIMARAANNIGILYERKGSYAEAIRFYELSLGKKRELNDLHGVGSTLTNLGSINKRIGKLDVAMSLLNEAVKIRSQVDDQLGITTVNDLKAEIYILKKEFKLAKVLVDSNYQRVR
jgi:tetratricopeptide (TPR) repeat protein